MATAERPGAEQRIVMHDISWQTYQRLLDERGERAVPRICYDQGSLELMSPSEEHESNKKLIGYLIFFWALENGIPLRSLGSTTFIRENQRRGFESDECYYIRNESLARGKTEIDLNADPPPDLVLEVEVSRKSLNKLKLFAGLGIPEVWRFDRTMLTVYKLDDKGHYEIVDDSVNLPGFPVKDVADWIARAQTTDETRWAHSFQNWIRQRNTSKSG